jgi:3',5'-nucleoside bisphosphate phosphatase
MIDLHLHTNASSDGQHRPREIFEMAKRRGLRAIAFADHNSVANVAEGSQLAAEFGIEFIPCLEINTFFNDLDLHLLAYFIDAEDPTLRNWLGMIHRKKEEQARKRLEKLNQLGFIFAWNDLVQFSGESIPTGASYLRAILSRTENREDPRLQPYIDGDRAHSPYFNFYRDFLRSGKPAYIPMGEILTVAAISQIKKMGGIPILAHPSDTGIHNILHLVENGLEGLEAYSSYHDRQEMEFFRNFAESHGLLITAGSDFHGRAIKPDIAIGEIPGNEYKLLLRLQERRKERP